MSTVIPQSQSGNLSSRYHNVAQDTGPRDTPIVIGYSGGMRVVLIGSSGVPGLSIARHLHDAGIDLTVVCRTPPDPGSPLHSMKWHVTDLRDPEGLSAILANTSELILNFSTPPVARPIDYIPERDALDGILTIAHQQRVSRIHYLMPLYAKSIGIRGFQWWLLRIKEQALMRLYHSPVPVIVLHHSVPMELFEWGCKMGDRLIIPYTDQRGVYWIAGSDIALAIQQLFNHPHGTSQEYVLQGPERLIPIAAARRLAFHCPPLTVQRIPYWPLALTARWSHPIQHIHQLIQAMTLRDEPFLASDTWQVLGPPQVSISAYGQMMAQRQAHP